MPPKSDKAHYISLMIILEIALWLREGWYVRSAVCDHVSGERGVDELISDTHKHTLRHIYPQRWAHMWKLAKIQKMAEIYTMWDAQHYNRCTRSHTQSCAKARAYTHARSWDLWCGWCGHDNKDTLFSCFQCKGYRQKNTGVWSWCRLGWQKERWGTTILWHGMCLKHMLPFCMYE